MGGPAYTLKVANCSGFVLHEKVILIIESFLELHGNDSTGSGYITQPMVTPYTGWIIC